MELQLSNIKQIKGKITLMSGLHIGSGDVEMRIGGIDNTVVKHPYTHEPYIPGSSIKGKVRSLLELKSGLMGFTSGRPVQLKDYTSSDLSVEQRAECGKILKLFGHSGAESDKNDLGPTRVSFADCSLNKEWKEQATNFNWPMIEIKAETAIDRIKGTAQHGSLRFSERVPANAEFDFSVTIKEFREDQEDLLDYLLEGLRLLELDSLGGSGSRGYGRIAFEFDDPDINSRFEKSIPQNSGGES
ncbi:type III-A CRISPR-associated RAMP protein Csm3 [Candidatus Micrarchaeota archaeon]|nr:type III-A CRISPR-associated RAMP protein Csm3 [Candidatus Micrarchaeota archaeon]